ncbi:DUF937 domain-containing protein [soil metagenome]
MAQLDEIFELIPIDQIASALGVDSATAEQAVKSALPALLGGLHANAQDEAGASSLASALATKDPSLVEGGVSLADIDAADGEKIVGNIFGQKSDQIASQLSAGSGTPDISVITKLLPLLAPIVMSFLAKKALGEKGAASGESAGGLGDILGGLLGGGSKSGMPDLGGLLGGLLGGGKR